MARQQPGLRMSQAALVEHGTETAKVKLDAKQQRLQHRQVPPAEAK